MDQGRCEGLEDALAKGRAYDAVSGRCNRRVHRFTSSRQKLLPQSEPTKPRPLRECAIPRQAPLNSTNSSVNSYRPPVATASCPTQRLDPGTCPACRDTWQPEDIFSALAQAHAPLACRPTFHAATRRRARSHSLLRVEHRPEARKVVGPQHRYDGVVGIIECGIGHILVVEKPAVRRDQHPGRAA